MIARAGYALAPLTLAAAGLLVACYVSPTVVGSRYVKSVQVDPLQGATLTISAEESPELAGTSLVIEPGALTEAQTVTVELGLDDITSGGVNPAGPVAIFGPAGLTFEKPARMTLPHSHSGPASELVVVVREADGRELTLSGEALEVSGGTVSFDVNGFTSFQPGNHPACATDADCPPAQVCRSGACGAPQDGGTGACQANAHCAAGEVCQGGVCVVADAGTSTSCVQDSDCAMGGVCLSGVCQPAGTACTANADCPPNELCTNGVCGPVPCDPRQAASCPSGEYCFVEAVGGAVATQYCAVPTGTQGPGDPCSAQEECFSSNPTDHSLWCSNRAGPATGSCRDFCSTNVGDVSCPQVPVAQHCVPIPGATPGLGYCEPA